MYKDCKKIEGRRRRGWQRMRWLDGITDSMTWVWASSGDGEGQGSLACCSPWGRKESDTTERLNWTELVRITESLCCTPETNTTLLINCSPEKHKNFLKNRKKKMLGIDERREDNMGFPKHKPSWLLLCLYKTVKEIVCLLCAHLC